MKGLKALRALPFRKAVTAEIKSENMNNWYYCSVDCFAYTASVIYSANGNVLVVCLYGAEKSGKRRKYTLPIIERHFLSETGEIASERFDGMFFSKVGSFTIGTTKIESWENSIVISHLKREDYREFFVPVNEADKVILGFAKQYKLYAPVKKALLPGKEYTSGLCWLAAQQACIKERKKEAADERREQRTLDRMRQVSEEPPEEFKQWVADERLSTAAWFYKFKGRNAEGVCGGCNQRAVIQGVENRRKGVCPHCGKPIQYVSIKKDDKFCEYRFNATFIERLSENEFVNRYFGVTKNYSNQDDKALSHTEISEYSREFFSVKDNGIISTGNYSAFRDYYHQEAPRWKRIPPRYYVLDPGWTCTANILEITQALAEQGIYKLRNKDLRALFGSGHGHHPIKMFTRAAELPALESLAKMGLNRLAVDILYITGEADCFCCLDTGSPAKLLGVDKLVLKKFVEVDVTLAEYLFWKDERLTLNDFPEFQIMVSDFKCEFSKLRVIMRRWENVRFGTMMRYLKKQQEKFGLNSADVVMYWEDYLRMIQPADVEQSRSLLYPENVKKEHDRLMALQEAIKNKSINEKLALRVGILDNLTFSDDDYTIFPLHNSAEFLNESNVLSHCVKTYTERCANGETNIFGLRQADEPDKPYFTVNIDNKGRLIQNRGKNNCAPPKEVKKFVDKWLKFVEKKLRTISLDPKAVLNEIKVKIGA